MSSSSQPKLPPVDGSLPVLPGFIDFHAEHNPTHPCFVFPFPDLNSEATKSVSFLEFAQATHRVAHIFRPDRAGPEKAVVAVLVNCDTLLYQALVAGLVRTGLVPFPMSPRNSAPAVASMMERSECHRIVSQPNLSALVVEAQQSLPSGWLVQVDYLPALVDVFPSLSSQDLAAVSAAPPSYPDPPTTWSPTDIVLYLHSSGSTGHPKPIPQTHQTILHWCHLPPLAQPRKRSIRWGCMALPPFHTMGLTTQLFSPLLSGQPTSLFSPMALIGAPPIVPNPQNTIDVARKTHCTVIETVPAFVEAWAQNDNHIEYLASLEGVVFGGGPLSFINGQKLVSRGVRLFACYGSTEIGTLTCIFDDDVDEPSPIGKTRNDWEWMQLPKECHPRWVPQGDGAFELQLLSCPTHQVSVENLPNGEHGYSTSDLWERHPTKPGLWRIVGRTDDVIVLGSGEKTVPIPQEQHIGAHPWVSGAVMFGRGHQQVGILVEPQEGCEVTPGDEVVLIKFRNAIWSHVEEANHVVPAFSRIFKEMILVADPARPFLRAAKGTVQRKKTLQLYEQDIRELYATIEESKNSHGIEPPSSWSVLDIQAWLTEHAAKINGNVPPSSDKDLFEQGFDSLSATYLRNRIIGALHKSPDTTANAAVQRVTPNIVFQYPTIASLARVVRGIVYPDSLTTSTQPPSTEIDEMIAKYTAKLPTISLANGTKQREGGAIVLLTGSTGSLGTHVLSLLLADPRVERVYALNRGSNLFERQRAAFNNADLPLEDLDGHKLTLLASDFAHEDLGLEKQILDELSGSVTHIIHNAWRVDFNLALASFETQIATAIRLLSLAPHAHYLFTSSISVAGGWHAAQFHGRVPESPLRNSTIAAETSGYGKSKYVVEEVLANARGAGLRTTSLRIGQISGSKKSGAWNTSDWVPSIVKSSLSLGALPDLHGLVSWVPMDIVANAIVDVMFTADPPDLVNVVHPKPVVWRDVAGTINEQLGGRLQCIALEEWVRRLGVLDVASPEAVEQTPGIKLLEFFRNMVAFEDNARKAGYIDIEAGGLPLLETHQLSNISQSFASLAELGDRDAESWVRYWRERGFLSTTTRFGIAK